MMWNIQIVCLRSPAALPASRLRRGCWDRSLLDLVGDLDDRGRVA